MNFYIKNDNDGWCIYLIHEDGLYKGPWAYGDYQTAKEILKDYRQACKSWPEYKPHRFFDKVK
jgi:hypothetical protein